MRPVSVEMQFCCGPRQFGQSSGSGVSAELGLARTARYSPVSTSIRSKLIDVTCDDISNSMSKGCGQSNGRGRRNRLTVRLYPTGKRTGSARTIGDANDQWASTALSCLTPEIYFFALDSAIRKL